MTPLTEAQRARITTPCPSCGMTTLFVAEGGGLCCSWLECPQPVVKAAHDALAARVRELDEQVDTLLNKNGDRIVASLLRTCLRCRRSFERESDVYRCVDCDAELHKDCAIQHFGQRVWPPTQACAVDAALREERAENQRFQQALKLAETLKAQAEQEKDALAARVAELEHYEALVTADAFQQQDRAIRTAHGWERDGRELPALVDALAAENRALREALAELRAAEEALRVAQQQAAEALRATRAVSDDEPDDEFDRCIRVRDAAMSKQQGCAARVLAARVKADAALSPQPGEGAAR